MSLLSRSRVLIVIGCLAMYQPSIARAPVGTSTIGEQREAVLSWPQAQREAELRQMDRRFTSDRVAHDTRVRPLPSGQSLALAGPDAPDWLGTYMESHHVAGVMVLPSGQVRLERYGLAFGPEQRWESFSVAKQVTSVLLGIALQPGHIASLDDLS